jgi:hypothetical protein
MPATRVAFAPSKEANRVTYQIVRQTAAGPVSIDSSGMTLLQPGDLVNIVVGAADALEPAAPSTTTPATTTPATTVPATTTPATTTPAATTPGERLPVERAANHQETGRTVSKE